MIQTLTVTTKGEVYWSVEVDDAEETVGRATEDEAFIKMHQRAQRLRAVLRDEGAHEPTERRRVGEIIRD